MSINYSKTHINVLYVCAEYKSDRTSALARLVLHMFIHKDTTFLFRLTVEYIIVYFGLFVGAKKLTVLFTILWWGQLCGNTNIGPLCIKTNPEECLNLPSLLPAV